MKTMPGLFLLTCALINGACLALNEFGEFNSARQAHPEFFKPGVVDTAKLGDEPWYVYCGEAEKCFDEEQVSELYEEAEVQAKMNFYGYFQKREKNPAVKVDASSARKLYQYADGKMYYVVFGVPQSGVNVSVPLVPAKAAQVAAQPAPAGTGNVPVQPVQASTPKPETAQTAAPVAAVPASKPEAGQEQATAAAPASAAAPAPAAMPKPAGDTGGQTISDDEILGKLRMRLRQNPDDFNTRIRMARIFERQGKPLRALRNYSDAARLITADTKKDSAKKIEALVEIAEYEESHLAGALALKHYRVLRRMGSLIANSRISRLLLKYK